MPSFAELLAERQPQIPTHQALLILDMQNEFISSDGRLPVSTESGFVDRIKDSIRRRGENISSWEVEQTLLTHPEIASCAVFGVPSEFGEEEVAAAIVAKSGASIDPQELTTFCAERLAYFAVPRYFDFVAELPLTENGKVRKAALRQNGVSVGAWDREAAWRRVRRHL